MTLPTSGPLGASDINTEANRSSNANAPLSGDSATPQTGSLVKIYENSGVNQSAPHSYSEFYGKTFTPGNNAYIENTGSSNTCTASIGTVRGPCDWNQSISSQLKALFEAGSNFNTDTEGVTIPGFNVIGNNDYGIIAYSVTVSGVGQIRKKKFNLDDDDNVTGITTCSTYDPSC